MKKDVSLNMGDSEQEKRVIIISKVEMWFARLFVTSILLLTGWLVKDYYNSQLSINEKITAVETELRETKPKDVLQAVNDLARETLTKEDVRTIVKENSPWPLVEKEWDTWRLKIEERIQNWNTSMLKIEKEIFELRKDFEESKKGK